MAEINSNSFPISLRPWAKEDSNAEPLGDLIYRINIERKGFRNVTEEQLREEIDRAANEMVQDEEVESDEEAKEDEEKGTAKYIAKKRAELTYYLRQAQLETQTVLDTVSLLESKYKAGPAQSTMSPSLAANIQPGVLSFDKWDMSKADPKKEEQDALVAAGWTMESLTSNADSLLKAATRLEEDVKRETLYWEQVLSLHTKGWPVFKVPGEQRTIAVQFSATEAGPLFKDRGIAALRTNKDGSIKLDQRLTMKPKMLRVRASDKGEIQGTSSISFMEILPDLDGVSLENMVRRAQDSLFDEELFQEMAMESRILEPLGVSLHGDVIHIPTSPSSAAGSSSEWLIDLIAVDDAPEDKATTDETCKSVATSLRLHLSHLYRQRLLRRSKMPPPLTDNRPPEPPAAIIRPLMAIWQHYNACKPFNAYLSGVASTFRDAGFSVGLEIPPVPAIEDIMKTLRVSKSSGKHDSALHSLMERLGKPMRTSASITPASATSVTSQNEKLSFQLTTNLSSPISGTEYVLNLPTKSASGTDNSKAVSHKDKLAFSSLNELQAYTDNILALDVIRNVISRKHSDWKCDSWKPEIRKVVEVKGKKAEAAIGVAVTSAGIEVHKKWASEARILQKENWDGKNGQGGLVDTIDDWIQGFQKG